jgi:GNAT superfamily N-acetyltransferase
MSAGIVIRRATSADISELVRLRRMMFKAMGIDDPCQLDASDAAAKAYFAAAIPRGEFHGWLAVTDADEAIGTGGIVIDHHPPGPDNLSGRVGYIMNVVTEPSFRRRGIARRVMHRMIEWLTEQGIHKITLHTSEMGRPLYEELGFVTGNEMLLRIG